jgi:parvulin-like peptidyl-prolyl isomerase
VGLSLVSALLLSGCSGKKVAAKVNGDVITEDDFYSRVQQVDAAQLAPALQGQGQPHAGAYALLDLINEKIILQYGAQKKVLPTDAEVNNFVAFAKKTPNPQLTWIAMDPFRSDAEWTREARLALIMRKLALQPLSISDQDLQKIYVQIKKQLTPPDRYRVRVVYLTSMQKADAALASLKKGVAFETVALTQSEDKASAAKNGELPPLADNPSNTYIHAIVSAAETLKPGGYTQQALTVPPPPNQKNGKTVYFIVQLIEKMPGLTPSFEEARPILEDAALQQKDPNALERVQQNIREFKDKADIQINLKDYQDLLKKDKSGTNQ